MKHASRAKEIRRRLALNSTLKTFTVVPFTVEEEGASYSMLQVECPSCHRDFWVHVTWQNVLKLESGRSYLTRSCPYCFKTAIVPRK